MGKAAVEVEVEVEELPKTIVRRVVKDKLSQSSNNESDIALHKDALLAFSESARIFIHYLSATANDICKESKRQTINADDVLKALEEIEFPEFIEPLKAALDEFRQRNAGKKAGSAKAKGVDKKRKMDETSTQNGNREEGGKDEEDEVEEEKEEEEEETNDDRSSLPDND